MKFEKYKQIFIICGLVIIIFIGIGIYYYFSQKNEEDFLLFDEGFNNTTTNELTNEEVNKIEEDYIMVHITGEVANPGIVKLKDGARVIDAIEEAGGKTPNADYSKVNLAYILEDGVKIYIPSVDDNEEYEVKSTISEGQKTLKININFAKQEDFEKIPGIGPAMALKIINYIKENGEFSTIEDLKKVSGIGNSKFNNIKQYVYVK